MEHRWGQRKRCRARVSVSAGAGLAGSARLRNVSISGAFLETALPLPLFAQVAIAVLRDDGSTHALEFAACVVRVESGGAGIEWCEPVTGSDLPAARLHDGVRRGPRLNSSVRDPES